MLRAGSMIVFAMNGCFVFSAAWFMMLVLAFGWLPPQWSHLLSWEEIGGLSHSTVTATKYMAILFYSMCIGFGVLIHMVIWKGLLQLRQWALWTILVAWGAVAAAMFAADVVLGGLLFHLNTVYNVVFLVGILLAGYGLFKPAERDRAGDAEAA